MSSQSSVARVRQRRGGSWRSRVVVAPTVALLGLVTACSSPTESGAPTSAARSSSTAQSPSVPAAPLSTTYPNSIVVLGHSGTTGYNSDPNSPGADANKNSWATGDNPAVQSIYLRLLALNPAVAGHTTNLGLDGSDMDALGTQVDQALALNPVPDLVMIQEVDVDVTRQCDSPDKGSYEKFAQTLAAQLTRITAAAPRATILLVSSPPGSVQNYGEVVATLPAAKDKNTGTGPCDMFDPAGKAVSAHWKYQEQVIRTFQGKLAEVCKRFPTCIYDDGALYAMKITAEDLAPDGEHLSVAGLTKQAALEWKVLGFGS